MKRGTRRVFTASAVALLLALAPIALFADHHEPPTPYMMLHHDDVGPGGSATYEEGAKAWVAAAREAELGADWEWRTYAGPNFEYVFLTDVPNYAYLDGTEARFGKMAEKIGAEKIAKLNAMASVGSHSHELVKRSAALSYVPEGGMGKVSFVHMSRHTVTSGMEDKFKELVAKVNEARKKVGSTMPVLGSEIQFGQGSFQFVSLTPDAASYYSAPSVGAVLNEAYGAEEAGAIFDAWRACITDYEVSDWEFRPDLSYLPGMYEADMAGEGEMKEGE